MESRTILIRHDLSGDFAPGSDLLPVEQQDPRDGGQDRGDAAQQAAGGRVAQASEHLVGEQGENGGEEVPGETLGGQSTRGVPMVDVGQVIEDGEVDGKDPHLGATQGQDRGDPVDARKGRPAEPEQPHGQQGGLEAGKVQPALGGGSEEFRPVSLGDPFLENRHDGGEDGSYGDRRKHGARLFGVETVAGAENEGDHGKGHVQQSPGEGGPETEKEHDGLGEHEFERDRERKIKHVRKGRTGFVGGDLVTDTLRCCSCCCCWWCVSV